MRKRRSFSDQLKVAVAPEVLRDASQGNHRSRPHRPILAAQDQPFAGLLHADLLAPVKPGLPCLVAVIASVIACRQWLELWQNMESQKQRIRTSLSVLPSVMKQTRGLHSAPLCYLFYGYYPIGSADILLPRCTFFAFANAPFRFLTGDYFWRPVSWRYNDPCINLHFIF